MSFVIHLPVQCPRTVGTCWDVLFSSLLSNVSKLCPSIVRCAKIYDQYCLSIAELCCKCIDLPLICRGKTCQWRLTCLPNVAPCPKSKSRCFIRQTKASLLSRSNSYERKDEQISGQTSPHLVLPPPPCKHTGNRRSSVDRSNGSRSKLAAGTRQQAS